MIIYKMKAAKDITKNFAINAKYYVDGIEVSLDRALMLWKKMHKDYDTFLDRFTGDRPTSKNHALFCDEVKKVWNIIPDFTVADAFAIKNIEMRRVYFKAIGVIDLFKELDPVLIDTKVLKKSGTRWDENNEPVKYTINDKYELYLIDGKKLYPEEISLWRTARANTYAVRCWCSTTEREYWIYVPANVGERKDALEAIAWTVRLRLKNPECIYRQGDVIIAKAGHGSTLERREYNLTAKEYKQLLVSAT
jgi:hypothetical protein